MDEEKKEGKTLIEETDSGRLRREEQAAKPKKSGRKWLIAVLAVVLVGVIAGLAVYHVRGGKDEDVYERTLTVVTKSVTTTEPEEEIEESDDLVFASDDAIGGDLQGETETTTTRSFWSTTTDEDSDDEEDDDSDTTKKTTKETTKRTTRRTTQWNPQDAQQAIEDFWNDVSKAVS